jgi:hypothetical protein
MLRSPPPSARLPPQQSSLAPIHGRPRSRTAPSTPLVEAPARQAPVELPGSIPDRPRASYHHSFDGKLQTKAGQRPRHEQPCKSARRPSHPWLHLPLSSHEETSTSNLSEVAAESDAHNLSQHSQWESSSDEYRQARASMPSGSTVSQARQSCVSVPPTSRHGLISRESHAQLPRSSLNIMREDNQHLNENQMETSEHNEVPLSDIASLHASHEDHMVTVVEAHEREVTSLRMYINFLEQRRGLPRTNEALSHTPARSCSKLDSSGNIAGRQIMGYPGHQSTAESSYLSQQNSHHGYIDSTVDAHCTSYAGYGEIWLECNHLRDSLETCKRQIAQAEETTSRMQRLELSLKNENWNLRCRLLAANNERMDVQEGLYEACKDLRNLAERETTLIRENEQLRRRSLNAARPTTSSDDNIKPTKQRKSDHCRTRSDASYQHARYGPPLVQNVIHSPMLPEDMQRHQIGTKLMGRDQQAQVDVPRRQFNTHESLTSDFTLSSARAISLTNVATPSLTAPTKIVTTATPRLFGGHRNDHVQVRDETGSQADEIKPSNRDLQGTTFDRPESGTPKSEQNTHPTTPKTKYTRKCYNLTARTPSPSPSLSSTQSSSTSSSALATSLPQTPRTVSSATAGAPMPTTGLCSLAHPRTPPAGMNKRLPKTPPLDSDPLLLPSAYSPVIKRGETMKSVGGSIIELYAGRGLEDDSGWEEEGRGEGNGSEGKGSEGKGWAEWV